VTSKPTAFVLLDIKLEDARAAMAHMVEIQARQALLRDRHGPLYSVQEHAELLALNLQGLYTKLEGIVADLLKEIDGDLPRSESWHKDLLLLAANATQDRPEVITETTFKLMSELLQFRHVVRSRYATELRPTDVFRNFEHAQALWSALRADLAAFVTAFSAPGR